MSKVGAKIKQAAGFIKEEAGEMMNDVETAYEGRTLRNKGRIEDGKLPKITPPGSTK